MYVEITHAREPLLLRHLSPTESIDPEYHALRWVEATYQGELRIAESDGHIPSGSADYRCEVRETKVPNVRISKSFDFYCEGARYARPKARIARSVP
jgi:hypothetical protein